MVTRQCKQFGQNALDEKMQKRKLVALTGIEPVFED